MIAGIASLPLLWLALSLGPAEELEQARILANDAPAKFADQLAEKLHAFEADPSTMPDEAAQADRIRGLLTLARAFLNADRPDDAAATMDRAIRASLGGDVPAGDFGPSLAELHAARRQAFGETGRLTVECSATCTAVVESRAVSAGQFELVPGDYEVRIGPDLEAALAAPVQAVTILPGADEAVSWAEPAPPPEPVAVDVAPTEVDAGAPKSRMLPRWAEITGLVLGVGALGAGAALIAIDGSCQGGGDPNDPASCPDVYETTVAGAVTMAGGGALLLTSGALLTVDEIRGRDGKKQAVLVFGYRGRF